MVPHRQCTRALKFAVFAKDRVKNSFGIWRDALHKDHMKSTFRRMGTLARQLSGMNAQATTNTEPIFHAFLNGLPDGCLAWGAMGLIGRIELLEWNDLSCWPVATDAGVSFIWRRHLRLRLRVKLMTHPWFHMDNAPVLGSSLSLLRTE